MNYIICGVGKVFDLYRDNFKALGEWEKNMGGVVYLCDRRFDEILTNEYMDFPLISLDKIKEMTDLVVFICARDPYTIMQMTDNLKGIDCWIRFPEFEFKKVIKGKTLNDMGKEYYKDCFENIVEFEDDISDNFSILFRGCHSKLYIGSNLRVVDNLKLFVGTDADIHIGKNCSFVHAELMATHSTIEMGDDCMFSKNVIIRSTDEHHIFDRHTGIRINRDSNVVLGRHVWVGEGVRILKGAHIGNGSVIGEASVVAGRIRDNVVAAGNPVKVVRRDVIWMRENTMTYNISGICTTDYDEQY